MIGIMGISFLVVQFAPGGPVEQVIAQLQGSDSGDRLSAEVRKACRPVAETRRAIAAVRVSIRS